MNKMKRTILLAALLHTLFLHGTADNELCFSDLLAKNQEIFARDPRCYEACYMCAYVLKEQGKMDEAIPYYKKLLEHNPYHTSAHIGLAQAYLALGNLVQGFEELEWRLGNPQQDTYALRTFLEKHPHLTGLRILIRAEWGLGDSLQFIRYAHILKKRGAFIIVELQDALGPLFKLLPYIDHIILPGDELIPFHVELPMLSLPAACGTTLKTIPNAVPYLYADQKLIEYWKHYFEQDSNFKIGICWHGNTIHSEDKFIPLDILAKLSLLPDVSIYSLQQHHGLEQLSHLSSKYTIRLLPDGFDTKNGSFMDTAAIMHHLDVIITVDTSLAHLAGGLGRPIWVILPHRTDWRWLQNRTDSPWYPTMKLFRQETPQQWDHVLELLKQEIQTLRTKSD
jgi:hypothetical protein